MLTVTASEDSYTMYLDGAKVAGGATLLPLLDVTTTLNVVGDVLSEQGLQLRQFSYWSSPLAEQQVAAVSADMAQAWAPRATPQPSVAAPPASPQGIVLLLQPEGALAAQQPPGMPAPGAPSPLVPLSAAPAAPAPKLPPGALAAARPPLAAPPPAAAAAPPSSPASTIILDGLDPELLAAARALGLAFRADRAGLIPTSLEQSARASLAALEAAMYGGAGSSRSAGAGAPGGAVAAGDDVALQAAQRAAQQGTGSLSQPAAAQQTKGSLVAATATGPAQSGAGRSTGLGSSQQSFAFGTAGVGLHLPPEIRQAREFQAAQYTSAIAASAASAVAVAAALAGATGPLAAGVACGGMSALVQRLQAGHRAPPWLCTSIPDVEWARPADESRG
jgi:hypothetical protein